MALSNQFYNKTTLKYITLFADMFNQISISRDDNTDTEVQKFVVPISYGPAQKFLARLRQNPDLDQKSAITVPRISFEIEAISYDSSRKLAASQKLLKTSSEENSSRSFLWSAIPYNLEITMSVISKYSEDAMKIFEQVVPYFTPEVTTSVELMPGLEPFDIPLILNGIVSEDIYEGGFEERRAVLWTFTFTMKAWYFGPEREKKLIKFVDVDMYSSLSSNTAIENINVYPGLTANGNPTSTANNSIPYLDIEFDDNYGIITEIIEGES